jgi:uncharacterized protein involved in outer membrane biogenesis
MRAFRVLIIAGGILLGLFILAIAIGTLWLNTYIRSAAFKAEVESDASQALGGTVQVQSIDFDIFHGVKLQGLVAQVDASHSDGQGALKVQAASVNCTYSWSDLLTHRLRLTGVVLDRPQILLTRQATAPATPAATIPPAPPTPGSPAPAPASGRENAMPFQFVLDGVQINDGSVSVHDAAGASIVELNGVNVAANTAGYYDGKDITGGVRITEMALPPSLRVTKFSTPFVYSGGGLRANPFNAFAFGGRMTGAYQSSESSATSVLDLNAKAVDVAQLTAATISNSSAKLSGSLDLQSKWRGVETGELNGEGDAQLVNGKLEGVKILQQLAQVLRAKELNAPAINSAKTHFVVQNQQTKFIGLQLESTGFAITGDGTIAFNGNLNANLVLILKRDTMGRLPKDAAASFVQQPDGSGSIAFQVTGTVSDPQTDLATRLLLQNPKINKAIDKALNKFFR